MVIKVQVRESLRLELLRVKSSMDLTAKVTCDQNSKWLGICGSENRYESKKGPIWVLGQHLRSHSEKKSGT